MHGGMTTHDYLALELQMPATVCWAVRAELLKVIIQ
jgi:hypothetical protein